MQSEKHTEDNKRIAQEKEDAAQVVIKDKHTAAEHLRSLGISRDKLTIIQIKVMLAPLKRQGDNALPILKADLQKQLVEWEARKLQSVEDVVLSVVRVATN